VDVGEDFEQKLRLLLVLLVPDPAFLAVPGGVLPLAPPRPVAGGVVVVRGAVLGRRRGRRGLDR